MSFADQVRAELAELTVRKPCCRRALCAGLTLCAEVEPASHAVSWICRQEAVAALCADLVRLQFGKEPESRVSNARGHYQNTLTVTSLPLQRLILRTRGEGAAPETEFACEGCRSAFLRGAFLSAGTINDPHKSFHLEFTVPREAVSALSGILDGCGYQPGRIDRPGGVGLYYKNGTAVEELLALMGAHHIIFEVMDSKIEREIRNNENRATNCVTKNIEKSIAAGTRQMEAIGELMETGKLETLPESLRTTAWIRYRNPDATLDELAALHTPPISKSGLNHRLQKLLEVSEERSSGKEKV